MLHFACAPSPLLLDDSSPSLSFPTHVLSSTAVVLPLQTQDRQPEMTGTSIFPMLCAGLRALCISLHHDTRRSRAKAETLMLAVLRVTLFNLLCGAKAKFPKLRSTTALQSPLLLLKGSNKTTQRRGWWDNVSTNLIYTAEVVHHFLLFCVCLWLFVLKQFDSVDF